MVYQGFRFSAAAIALMLFAMPALLAMPAAAEEAKDSSATTPRQVAHCMMKRLRADRTESYRDAFKVCKQDLAAGSDRNGESAMNTSRDEATAKQD